MNVSKKKQEKKPQKLTAFRYDGPFSGVTLEGGKDEQPLEVLLHPGSDVWLPPANPYVQRLKAKGYLLDLKQESAAKVTSPSPAPQLPETTPTPSGADDTTDKKNKGSR